MSLEEIVEILKIEFPDFNSCDFIIGKYNDDITVDDVFDIIKNTYKDFFEKRNLFAKDCKKYGMYYDNKREKFRFKKGAWYDKENVAINKEVERKYGINGIDCFKSDIDLSLFNNYQEYEDYWIKKIENLDDDDISIFAPFSIVDFSTQEDYFPIQNGFVYENKLLLESSLKAKKEIVLNCANCYNELSEINSDEISFDKVLNCDDCPNDKKVCRAFANICNNVNEEDLDILIGSFGKIGVFFRNGYLTPRIASELNKKSIYTGKVDIKTITSHLSWYYAGILS